MASLDGMRDFSLDDRIFRASTNSADGETGEGTVFTFHEDDHAVWADYSGGSIVRGFLVGLRSGDRLHIRYAQLNQEGETSTGRSDDRIELLPDGRIRIHEDWAWESRVGSGVSVLEEV